MPEFDPQDTPEAAALVSNEMAAFSEDAHAWYSKLKWVTVFVWAATILTEARVEERHEPFNYYAPAASLLVTAGMLFMKQAELRGAHSAAETTAYHFENFTDE